MDDAVEVAAWSACCAGAGLDGRKVSAEALRELRGDSVVSCSGGDTSEVACVSSVGSGMSQHGSVVLRTFA